MRKEDHKLARDRIPENIPQGGEHCKVVTQSKTDSQHALRQKLVEEVREAAMASMEDLVTELADLQEMIGALVSTSGIEPGVGAPGANKARRISGVPVARVDGGSALRVRARESDILLHSFGRSRPPALKKSPLMEAG